MPKEQTLDDFWNKSINIVLKSVLAVLCIFLFFAEGILILNMLVSFRRKERNFIYNPLIAISIGVACTLIPFLFLNFDIKLTNSLTLEIFKEHILSAVALSLPITGAVSVIVYIVKENLYMKGRKADEQ